MRSSFAGKITIAIALSAMLVGYLCGISAHSASAVPDAYDKLDIYSKVLHYIETNYVDEVDRTKLVYGSIKGMMSTLDPHTVFMPPDVYKEMKIDTTGEFCGVGLVVEIQYDRPVIVDPIEDSPAARAGLEKDDVIMVIDGKDTLGLPLQDAVSMMRGQIGTRVKISVLRATWSEPREFTILRSHIRVASVTHKLLEGGIAYSKISSFVDRTSIQLVRGLQRISVENGKEISGIILDLRGNPGGLLEEAVRVVDEFISSGVIVSTEGRNGGNVEINRARRSGNFLDTNLALLIDGRSASAAEIVAGALQDHDRAILFGTRSYGKGSVQNVIDLDDGSGLKITVARYFTPTKRSIDKQGIPPEVVVAQPADIAHMAAQAENDSLEDLPEFTGETGLKLIEQFPSPAGIDEEDHQLRAAWAYLRMGRLP